MQECDVAGPVRGGTPWALRMGSARREGGKFPVRKGRHSAMVRAWRLEVSVTRESRMGGGEVKMAGMEGLDGAGAVAVDMLAVVYE